MSLGEDEWRGSEVAVVVDRRKLRIPGCIDLNPGPYVVTEGYYYHSEHGAARLECQGPKTEVRAGETSELPLSCDVDVTGRWFRSGRQQYLAVVKVGTGRYRYTWYRSPGGEVLSSGEGRVKGRTFELRGTGRFGGEPLKESGKLVVEGQQMSGEIGEPGGRPLSMVFVQQPRQ